ncbi:hypothetical protein vseg_010864 [Gypsophila vaccaria]
MAYSPPINSSGVWRRICSVKDKLALKYTNGHWSGSSIGYFTAVAYEWMRGSLKTVPWHSVIWNKWVTPIHQFLGWVYARGGLRTNDMMQKLGLTTNEVCYLCGQAPETTGHLFFDCDYNKQVTTKLMAATSLHIPQHGILDWCAAIKGSELQ